MESMTSFATQLASDHRILFTAIPCLTIFYFIYCTIIYPKYVSPLRHIPGPPILTSFSPFAPFKGQFPAIINGEAGIPQREWMKQYGGEKGVIRVVGPVGIERVMFSSPEACERILLRDWTDYPRPKFLRDTLALVTGHGLLTVTKNEHRQMRRMMSPAFSLPNLVSQMDEYHNAIESLIKVLDAQISSSSSPGDKVLPVYEWMSKVTLDIICATAFSYYPNALHDPNSELAHAYEQMIELQSGRNVAWMIGLSFVPGFASFIQSDFAWKIRKVIRITPGLGPLAMIVIDSMHRIRGISRGILEEKVLEIHTTEMEKERKKDIMSLLVRARKESLESEPTGWSMGDEAMMDQVLTFLGAGHETTASGLAWTLYLLAANKEAQDKLREEVTPVLAGNPRPEYRTLKELQWLDSVVMESLRVLPPVPMTFRQATKTEYIDGILIPKGTILYIPIRVINTWKSIWGPDAEEFRPARWLNLPKTYNSQYSLMSFIVGPHACIGKTMAIIEMKAVLASLVANFEFDLAYEGQKPQTTSALTMKPKDNMPLRVRRVERKAT